MLRTIRLRLTLSHLAVIVLAMVLSGLLLLSFLERYFLQAAEESLAAQARITTQALLPGAIVEGPSLETEPEEPLWAPAINAVQQQRVSNLALQAQNVAVPTPEPAPADGELDLSFLADASLQLSSQLETRIRILDAGGVVQVDSQSEGQGADLRNDPLVRQALAGEYASSNDRAMHVAMPATVDGRLVGVVYLSQPLDDLTAVIADLRSRWLLATGIALLLSGAAGLLLSGAIARPVRRLTAAAGRVAEGQLDQQVPVSSQDELGRLSQAFNEMVARLRAARQMQTDFVANVSHELRTPLTALKGTVETLRDGAVDDRQVRDRFLETVESETDRLIRLVNDLLTLSRADSGALDLRPEATDLVALVRATVERLGPQAERRKVALQVDARPDCPLAWADPDRLQQVLVNLLDNAIKYARPGSTVTAVCTLASEPAVGGEPERQALVQVQDEGPGIPAEKLSRIGQRFYRADQARSREDGGSGLGLAIARALVQAHGGRLWVESEEGVGTVVSFTLPALGPAH